MSYVTAIHEAGHAWAYHRNRLSIRYVTIRPRGSRTTVGRTAVRPRLIDPFVAAFIACAGPVAEAIHSMRTDEEGYAWEDYMVGAVLAGGHDDRAQSLGLIDDHEYVRELRRAIEADWPAVAALADLLGVSKTVAGRAAFEVLNGGAR